MIDLHSHLLPGVDDGSRSVDQSVKVLGALASEGLTDICLTPHLKASQAAKGPPAAHDRAFDALLAAAPATPRLHRGAEVMLDRPLTTSPEQLRRVTLGGTRYILVEFPRMVALDTVTNALSRILDLGLVPLLAHPERYSCCSPDAVNRWRSLGAGGERRGQRTSRLHRERDEVEMQREVMEQFLFDAPSRGREELGRHAVAECGDCRAGEPRRGTESGCREKDRNTGDRADPHAPEPAP